MSFKKSDYTTFIEQAKNLVPEFRNAFDKFIERITIDQNSKSLIINYGRSVSQVALHFTCVPHKVSVDEINSYLYRISVHEKKSESYFKQTVYGLRYWFRLFGEDEKALRLPAIKKTETLPVVLSKQECRELFKAPRLLKRNCSMRFTEMRGLFMPNSHFSDPNR